MSANNLLVPGISLKNKIILKVKNKTGTIDTYIYSSSVPDHFYKKESGVVRATNLFCKFKISTIGVLRMRQLKDGRTKYESFAQADPNFFFNIMPIFKRL